MRRHLFIIIYLVFITVLPAEIYAATFSRAVWIPYWKEDEGATEVSMHLDRVTELSPFVYEVNADGIIVDKGKLDQAPWPDLFAKTRASKTRIIPTITWTDSDAIHKALSSTALRTAHINAILGLVAKNDFGGIDIDYENKHAKTRVYFSRFLREFGIALYRKYKDSKLLSCTIEARTPLLSRFKIIPKNIEYANDFTIINRYCDEVRIMAYDQFNIDIKLNKQKGSNAKYAPIADIDWVKKVLDEALRSISRKKIMLTIPTYGYEYEVVGTQYNKLHSISYQDAMGIARGRGITPLRNRAGELSYEYQDGGTTHLVWFSDAKGAADKIALAKKYKLRGVAIFKIDGTGDQALWSLLK